MNSSPARDKDAYADAERALRHVFVRDLELEAEIGVHAREQNRRQPVRINIDLAVHEGDGPRDDELESVVCYGDLVAGVKAIIAAGRVGLVETLAERIAERCLADHRVARVRVRVEKLEAIAEAASAGIEIERVRS